MRNRIFLKLLAVFVLVIAAITLTMDIAIRRAWEASLRQQIERDLTQKAHMFALRVDSDREHDLSNIAAQVGQAAVARATVIDAEGKVLADSQSQASENENYRALPEFRAALQGDTGIDTRRTQSLQIPYLYVAVPVAGGAVRLAYPLSDVETATSQLHRTLLLGSSVAILLALVIAGLAARSIEQRLARIVNFADRIASGNLNARIAESSEDEIGQVAGALDLTARQLEHSFAAVKTSQRQLETLLNSMQDAVIAVGADDRVQWANQTMNRMAEQRIRLHAPLVETVRDPDFLRVVREAIESKQACTARANSILPGRIFDVTAAPMPGGGAVSVLRDLTETERVEKTRRDFIANVSHELRTPLTSIQGYTETLLESISDQDHSREFLEIIRKNATRMSRLTEDLLTLARVESGEQRFEIAPVGSSELLGEAVRSFQELARANGVDLEVEDTAHGLVAADSEAIHQVFSNLIENAFKYARSGSRLILGARLHANGVQFFVRDFGPGIPSEHLPRLFERFYRVDKARSRESGGTGLGLAIVKHIVLAHGGTVSAESELHHGSTFLFTLPLAAVPESQPEPTR